jgi:PhnB protein
VARDGDYPAHRGSGAERAAVFYREAFEAEELTRIPTPDGRLMSVQLRIGDGRLHLADEFPEFGVLAPPSIGGTAVVLSLDLEDAEAVFAQALGSGAEVRQPLHEASWGDLHRQLDDPFGHRWNMRSISATCPTRRSWPPPLRRSPEMRYRLLGPFGLRISEFCLSAMVFGCTRRRWLSRFTPMACHTSDDSSPFDVTGRQP